jgi:hypothetical protein
MGGKLATPRGFGKSSNISRIVTTRWMLLKRYILDGMASCPLIYYLSLLVNIKLRAFVK